MWFRIELPQSIVLTELQFDSPTAGGGRSGLPVTATSPRSYRVEVSTDGTSWTEVAQGQGGARTTTIVFSPVTARMVRITQTADAKDTPSWSMERLRVFQPAGDGAVK
jgi:F5/8 type C domain-containing protein